GGVWKRPSTFGRTPNGPRRIGPFPGEETRHAPTLRGLDCHTYTTEEANARARQMFAKAVELDPQFAAAYTCLGWGYFDRWSLGWSQDPQTLEQAFALAQQAIA